MLAILHLPKTQRRVCASKAKAIRQGHFHLFLLRSSSDIITIEIFRRVARIVEIESRWKRVLAALAFTTPHKTPIHSHHATPKP